MVSIALGSCKIKLTGEQDHPQVMTFDNHQFKASLVLYQKKRGHSPLFIAVSSFGESHHWVSLTTPVVARF